MDLMPLISVGRLITVMKGFHSAKPDIAGDCYQHGYSVNIHHISSKCYMVVSTHDLWWERGNSGSSDMWSTANCFALKGSHIEAEDVFGCQDVCLGDGTVGQLIGSHDADELLGTGLTNLDLELSSC